MNRLVFFADIGEALVKTGALDQVYEHMTDDLPNECVGLVWGDGHVTRLINQARSPERFTVSVAQMAEALTSRDGLIVCVYHSHPKGTTGLSIDDQRSMREEWANGYFIPWLVVTETTATIWYVDGQGREISYYQIPSPRNGLVHV